MPEVFCWNCRNNKEENIRSPRTGIVYCVSCGVAINDAIAVIRHEIAEEELDISPTDFDSDPDSRQEQGPG